MTPAHAPRTGRALLPLAALAALTATACGPSPWQAGTAVLLATPIAVLVGHLLLFALVAAWRARHPALTAPWRAPLVIGVGALATGVVLAVTGEQRLAEWPTVAIITFGSTYLLLALLAFRVALVLRPAGAVAIAHIAAAATTLTPAVIALVTPTAFDVWLGLWSWPGIYGIPTAIVLVLLVTEAAWATRRSRPAPPDPRAPRRGDP